MNQRTFNAWLKLWGYRWTGDEEMVKGFMTAGEATTLANQLEAEGRLTRG